MKNPSASQLIFAKSKEKVHKLAMRNTVTSPLQHITLLLLLCVALPAWANTPVQFSTSMYSVSSLQMHGTLIALGIHPSPGYYFYANSPGDFGRPLTITPEQIPDGMTIRYPVGTPQKDRLTPSKTVNAHQENTSVYLYIPQSAKQSTMTCTVSLLLCSKKACWPVLKRIHADWSEAQLPAAENQPWWKEATALTPQYPSSFVSSTATLQAQKIARQHGIELPASTAPQSPLLLSATSGSKAVTLAPQGYAFTPQFFLQAFEVASLGKAILLGILAGFILNFMPCVLPVISLKLSTFVSTAHITDEKQRRAHFREHNIFFACGILVWFLSLAAILSAAGMVWGQLFQSQYIVTSLLFIMFILALSTFGVFELPMLSLRSKGKARGGRWQAFSTGLLATLLATPCSGPFLGGVLGWAFLQPPFMLGIIFAAVGIGMALPYGLMALFPSLLQVFPKPGNWTLLLEKVLGFFLMGTVGYLLSILPPTSLPSVLIMLWIIAVGAWITGRYATLRVSTLQRWGVRIAMLSLVAGTGIWILADAQQTEPWHSFTKQTFRAKLEKQAMLLDFTADWCPNCKVLEHSVLTAKNRARWAKKYNLTFIKVDLTRESPDAQALLSALGSQSIPVVAIFPTGSEAKSPTVLRDLFTTAQLEAALKKAFP